MPPEAAREPVVASLADLTHGNLIVDRLRERDAAGIIGELSRRLGEMDYVPDALSFYQAVLNLKLLSDSPAPSGVALAHARMNGIKRLCFAFGRASLPVVWNAKDSRPVRLVFLVAVPPAETCCYLQLLSSLARLGQCADVVAELLEAANADGILAVFKNIPLSKQISFGLPHSNFVS